MWLSSDHVVINSGSVTLQAGNAFAVLDWKGGAISGSLTVANSGVMNVSGNDGKELYGAVIIASGGRLNWSGAGYLRVWNNNTAAHQGSISNLAGGLFDIQNDQSLVGAYGSEPFNNAGTFRKSAGAGTSSVGGTFSNTGTVEGQTGTLSFPGGYSSTSSASVAISLGGSESGSGYGRINFLTPLSLDGTFTVSARNGYLPAPGTVFQVLIFPPATPLFACSTGLDLGGGVLLQPKFDTTTLTLSAAAYTTHATQPQLFINRTRGGLAIIWPEGFGGWTLQSSTNLLPSSWTPVASPCANPVFVPTDAAYRYFRLRP